MTLGIKELERLMLRLRLADFSFSPDQVIAAHDVLVWLHSEGNEQQHPMEYCMALAPVFCRTHEEQRAFYQIFDDLAQGRPGKDQAPEFREKPPEVITQDVPRPSRRWIHFLVLAIVVAIGARLFVPRVQQQPVPVAPPPSQPTPENPVEPAELQQPVQIVDPAANILPRPPEDIPAHAQLGSIAIGTLDVRVLIAQLPLLLLIVVGAYYYLRKRALLRRTSAATPEQRNPPEPHLLYVRGAEEGLFATQRLRQAIDRLRTADRIVVREIDARRTVEMSARKGGLFAEVHRTRLLLPEYVVLIDRARADDQLAAFSRALVERLRRENIAVFVHYFNRDPQRCYAEDRSMRAITLDELESRHGRGRLVLITDGAGCFSALSGRMERWTRKLTRWPVRMILTPVPANRWGAREFALASSGVAVAPLDGTGLDSMARWLVGAPSATGTGGAGIPLLRGTAPTLPLPRIIEAHFDHWVGNVPPAGVSVDEMVASVESYLGPQGFLVLCALAIYPQMSWQLSLYIDWRLTPELEPGVERETRLFNLARLPWLRHGSMPDYLRTQLVRTLPSEREAEVREMYRALLASAMAQGPTAFALRVDSHPSKEGWRDVQIPFAKPAADTVYADRSFAAALLGGHQGLVDLERWRAFGRWLPQRRWLRRFTIGIAGYLAASVLGVIVFLATYPFAYDIEHALFLGERSQNEASIAFVFYDPDRRALAYAFGATLTDRGYTVYYAHRKSLTTESTAQNDGAPIDTPELKHSIEYSDEDASRAKWAADRLKYLSYGPEPNVSALTFEKLDEAYIRVIEDFPGRVPDDYPNLLITLVHRKAGKPVFNLESNLYRDPGAEEIFQDRLQKGGLGPQVVWMPPEPVSAPADARMVFSIPFAIGRFEVTVGEFRRFSEGTDYRAEGCTPADETPGTPKSWRDPGFTQSDEHPVVCVSGEDAERYAAWLSAQTGQRYRLPTKDEWLGSVAAVEPFIGPSTEGESQCLYGNARFASENVRCAGHVGTTPVGQFRPSVNSLYDALGNAAELTGNCLAGGECSVHGIGWSRATGLLFGPSDRSPSARDNETGFRVVREVATPVAPREQSQPEDQSPVQQSVPAPTDVPARNDGNRPSEPTAPSIQ